MVKQLQKWFMMLAVAVFATSAYADETIKFDFTNSQEDWGITSGTTAQYKSTSNIPASGFTKDGVTITFDGNGKTQVPIIFTNTGNVYAGSILYGASGNIIKFAAPAGKAIKGLKFNTYSSSYVGFTSSKYTTQFPAGDCVRDAVYQSTWRDCYVSWVGTSSYSTLDVEATGSFRWLSIEVTLTDGEGSGNEEKNEPIYEYFDVTATNSGNTPGNVQAFSNTFTISVPTTGWTNKGASTATLSVPGYDNPFKATNVTVKSMNTLELTFATLTTIEDGEYTLNLPEEFITVDKSTSTQIEKHYSRAYTATWNYKKPFIATVDVQFDNNTLLPEGGEVAQASNLKLVFNKAYENVACSVDRLYYDEENGWAEDNVNTFYSFDYSADKKTWTSSFDKDPQIFLADNIYKIRVRAWDGEMYNEDLSLNPCDFEKEIQFNGTGSVPALNWTWTINPANESTVETVSKVTLTFPNLQEVYIPTSYTGGGAGPLKVGPGFGGTETIYAMLNDENDNNAEPIYCYNAETDYDNPNSIIFTFDAVPAGTYSFMMTVPVASLNAIDEEIYIDSETYGYPSTTFTTTKQGERVASIDINVACTDGEKYYSTFSASVPVYAGEDLEVYEIAVDNDGVMTLTAYDAYETIPANTGVLVASTEAGVHALNAAWDEGESKLGTANCLRPYTETMSADNNNYRLTMHNGETIGFFWGAENGGVFDIAINRAYLAVPKTVTAKGLWFNGNTATGINTVNVEKSSAIYNIAGQRVNNNAKGVVIMNGVKVVK